MEKHCHISDLRHAFPCEENVGFKLGFIAI